MNSLKNYKDLIFAIKNKVENLDNSLFEHKIVNNLNIDNNTISIIMTSSDRSKQTYFTLDTIKQSSHKNIQIIIVDDSTHDPINIEILEKYPFYIDFLTIKRANKNWHNPLVNYNLGFKFIKGSKVIIQNAEVCHVGDVINFINNNAVDNNYYVFDVKACRDFNCNETIYKIGDNLNTSIFEKDLYRIWYQHRTFNRNLHFLVGMSTNTFNLMKNFSYDCTMGISYDDDDFLLKIKSKKINIVNIFSDVFNLGGVHLFHKSASEVWDHGKEINDSLFQKKQNLFYTTGHYADVTNNYELFDSEYNKLC